MRSQQVISTLAACTCLLSGCAAPTETASPPPTHFSGSGITFDYPGKWNATHFDIASSHIQGIVFLSTELMSDPCTRTANRVSCGSPVSALSQDGVVVDWSHWDFAGWTLDRSPGSPTEIGGRRAKTDWTAAVSAACSRIGGGGELVATIEIPAAPENWIAMRACVAGPDYAVVRAQLDAMLASVAWND